MTKKLSDLLLELSEKAKALEIKAQQERENTKEKIENWASEVKAKSEADQQAFKVRVDELKTDAKTHWQKIQDNFDSQIAKAKSGFNDLKQNIKASDAEMYTNWAEDDAEMSIYFAIKALSDAEQAVAEAFSARLEADSYKK